MISLNNTLIKELSLLPEGAKIMIIGEADTGKSTVVAALARWFQNQSQKVAVVDSDMGQSDIGPPGFISYGIVERDIVSLQSITNNGSYLIGKTSPYGRELSMVTGTKVCVEAAGHQGTAAILIDTCGLVKSLKGIQLKCAKAEIIKPDLILALKTLGIAPLINRLNLLGFHVRSFLPSEKVRAKPAKERKENRISGWNTYMGNDPSFIDVRHSRTAIRRWWDENRYIDIDQIPHGTVAAIRNSVAPEFQIPCIWTISEDKPFILVPLPKDYELNTIWISAYKLELNGNTVISA